MTEEKITKIKLIQGVLSLTVTFVMLIISAVILFFGKGSMAWFSKNKKVNAGGALISFDNVPSVTAKMELFEILGVDSDGNYFFSHTSNPAASLRRYSILNGDGHQLLIKVTFIDTKTQAPVVLNDFTVTAKTDTNYFLGDGEHDLLPAPDGVGENYYNALSSIVVVSAVTVTEGVYDAQTAYVVSDLGEKKSFIDKQTYTIKERREFIVSEGVTAGEFWLIIDYDSDLISKIFSVNIGNQAIDASIEEIRYYNDLRFEITLNV